MIVLDTNVLVSALLNPRGAPARVLDLFLGQALTLRKSIAFYGGC